MQDVPRYSYGQGLDLLEQLGEDTTALKVPYDALYKPKRAKIRHNPPGTGKTRARNRAANKRASAQRRKSR